MHEHEEDLTPVERTRRARDEIVRRCKTLKGLCQYYRRLEKKYPPNLAESRRLLAEREARHAHDRSTEQEVGRSAGARRSA